LVDAAPVVVRQPAGTDRFQLAIHTQLQAARARIGPAAPLRFIADTVLAEAHGDGGVEAHAGGEPAVRLGYAWGRSARDRRLSRLDLQTGRIAYQDELTRALEVVEDAVLGAAVGVALAVGWGTDKKGGITVVREGGPSGLQRDDDS